MTNDLESTKDEIHIHTESSLENHRFPKYIGDSNLLIFKKVDLKTNIVIRENLKLMNGTFDIGSGNVFCEKCPVPVTFLGF